jgi:hypothetical protein
MPTMPPSDILPSLAADTSIARSIIDLAEYPNVPGDVLCRHAKLLGQAGEALVDSLFMRAGITPLKMPEGLPSDRLFLLPQGTLTAQIKIQTRLRGDSYVFTLQRGYRGSPSGCRAYERGDFDLAILVILPALAVKVVQDPGNSVRIREAELPALLAHPLGSFWRAVDAHRGREHPGPDRAPMP